MKITELKLNPKNPRIIKDDKFKKLVNSIKSLPKMMELKPIIVDDDNFILGGNMRYKALIELNYTEIPDNWVKKASEYTEEEKKQVIITDNTSFGEWDWNRLANEWESELLGAWGIDLPTSWGTQDEIMEDKKKKDNELLAIVIVAYDNIDDLDKITSLYELDSEDISDNVKNQISRQRKMYVFKK